MDINTKTRLKDFILKIIIEYKNCNYNNKIVVYYYDTFQFGLVEEENLDYKEMIYVVIGKFEDLNKIHVF